MARKQVEKFDVAGLKALMGKLETHRDKLVSIIAANLDGMTFDKAVKIRDASQYVVTTCLCLQNIPESNIPLAEMRGPQEVPHLNDCGLDWNPDEE